MLFLLFITVAIVAAAVALLYCCFCHLENSFPRRHNPVLRRRKIIPTT